MSRFSPLFCCEEVEPSGPTLGVGDPPPRCRWCWLRLKSANSPPLPLSWRVRAGDVDRESLPGDVEQVRAYVQGGREEPWGGILYCKVNETRLIGTCLFDNSPSSLSRKQQQDSLGCAPATCHSKHDRSYSNGGGDVRAMRTRLALHKGLANGIRPTRVGEGRRLSRKQPTPSH